MTEQHNENWQPFAGNPLVEVPVTNNEPPEGWNKQSIVFLDYDGVVATKRSRSTGFDNVPENLKNSFIHANPEPYAIDLLKELQNETKCKFVIISRWASGMTRYEWHAWFLHHGFDIDLHEDWISHPNDCIPKDVNISIDEDEKKINSLLYVNKVDKVDFKIPSDELLMAIMDRAIHLDRNSSLFYMNKAVKQLDEMESMYRGWAIAHWLNIHGETSMNTPAKFNYIVIDDEIKSYPLPLNYLVHIEQGEYLGGFGLSHLNTATWILKAQDKNQLTKEMFA